jgi:hypothetical protein
LFLIFPFCQLVCSRPLSLGALNIKRLKEIRLSLQSRSLFKRHSLVAIFQRDIK